MFSGKTHLNSQKGFILIFSVLMMLGISAMAVGMVFNSYTTRVTAQNYKNKVQSFYAADGIMTMLADEVLSGRDTLYTNTGGRGKITAKLWSSNGSNVKSFYAAVQNASLGNSIEVTSNYLGSYWNSNGYNGNLTYKDDYGLFWQGYIYAPTTGYYTFYVRADDQSEFYLSTDEAKANRSSQPIAYNYSYMAQSSNYLVGGWPTLASQPSSSQCNNCKVVSDPQMLTGGKRYYFEYYHKEGGGGDYGQVGWSGPEWITEKPIPANRLAPYDNSNSGIDSTLDSIVVGSTKVNFRVSPLGSETYSIFAESYMQKGGKDSVYKTSLLQKLSLHSSAVLPPDTSWARVIYYDYSTSNISASGNPEFQNFPFGSGGGSAHTGMVQTNKLKYTTLDASYFARDSIGKPLLTTNASNIFYNCAVERWFTPWNPADTATNNWMPRDGNGDNSKYNDCTPKSVKGTKDTAAYKNYVIKDSLPFIRQGELGTYFYRYAKTGSASDSGFFPIDGKGWGKEGKSRNYSFCMEMHGQFAMAPGMSFDFKGDDDVWLFINNTLVMDLGGDHVSLSGSVNFDYLGLSTGSSYPFDLFYCERMVTESDILITTNLPMGKNSTPPKKNWKRDYGSID